MPVSLHRPSKDLIGRESKTRNDIAELLDSFPPLPFLERGVIIAPFVDIGNRQLTDKEIGRRRLKAPLVGHTAVAHVALNERIGVGVSVANKDRLTYILRGEQVRALRLGETPDGEGIFLTPTGHIGESLPAVPPYDPLESFDPTIRGRANVSSWLRGPDSEILPAVSLSPYRHVSNFPDQIIRLIGHVSGIPANE